MGFLLDVIFHFCPPMGTIKTMVFHLSTLWVLLGPWFSVFPENSQAGSTVQKHVWYYWDHGFSFKHPMGTIRTMVFCLSTMWVLFRLWFSKKHSDCCYSTHGFNSAGKSTYTAAPGKNFYSNVSSYLYQKYWVGLLASHSLTREYVILDSSKTFGQSDQGSGDWKLLKK